MTAGLAEPNMLSPTSILRALARAVTPLVAGLLVVPALAAAQTPEISRDSALAANHSRLAYVHADSGLLRIGHVSAAVTAERLPSGAVVLRTDSSVHGGLASIIARTPTGTFFLHVDSTAAAGWADSAARLREPQPVVGKDGGAGTVSLSGVMLAHVNNSTVMRLLRLGVRAGDSLPSYRLDATNGAWDGHVRLDGAEARDFFAALRGATPPMPDDPDQAFLERQVDEPVKRLGGPRPDYPAERPNVNGDIEFSFVVGVDGRAEPGSLGMSGDADPAFALAARESVLKSRYRPAKRAGAPVRQVVSQWFSFRIQ